jgi:hypothetical protein
MAKKPKPSAEATARVDIRRISPAEAGKMLEKNSVNRNIRRKLVTAYRADMENGRWQFTGEPIQFSRSGRLLNGQHRLAALAGAKGVRALDFVVASGLTDDSQTLMDQGKARTVADAIVMYHGGAVKNLAVCAGVARWLVLIPEIHPGLVVNDLRDRKVTAAEAMVVFEEHNEAILTAAREALALRPHLMGSPTSHAYTWFQLARVDKDKAGEFFHGITHMNFGVGRDPRKAAVRRLQALAREETTSLDTGFMSMSVLSRCWNDWRAGKEVDSYNVRSRMGPVAPVKPV